MSENVENKATRGSIAKIILTALLGGDKYGYEICKEIENLSDGNLVLKQPSLYSCLRRMEENDLISSYWQDSEIGGKRHYYSLTAKGKAIVDGSLNNDKMEELIKNLPLNDVEIVEKKYGQTIDANKISVARQENLFNLTPKTDIKYIDEINKESENNSFVQYDLFNQNIKFVKDSSKNTDKVESYKNKYIDMDNHGVDIEPVKKNEFSEQNCYEKAINDTNINLKKDSKDESNENVSLNMLSSLNRPITRDDVYNDIEKTTAVNEMNKKEDFSLKFSFDDDKDIDKEKATPPSLSQSVDCNFSEQKKDIEEITSSCNTYNSFDIKEDLDNRIEKNCNNMQQNVTSDNKKIEWNNLDKKNDEFVDQAKSNDYKMIIGQLYNTSKLADPYEENKFFVFKEIFPSAKIEEKKDSVPSKSEYSELVLLNTDTTKQKNIKIMQEQFSLQGLKLKIHDNSQNKSNKKVFVDINRLNMNTSWIVSFIMILEILCVYMFLKKSNNLVSGQSIVYFLSLSISLGIAIIVSLENLFDRFKLIEFYPNFKQRITKMIIIFIFLSIIIFATCLLCGMENLTQKEYLSYWLIPILMSSNLILYTLIYWLLYKTGKYNN